MPRSLVKKYRGDIFWCHNFFLTFVNVISFQNEVCHLWMTIPMQEVPRLYFYVSLIVFIDVNFSSEIGLKLHI